MIEYNSSVCEEREKTPAITGVNIYGGVRKLPCQVDNSKVEIPVVVWARKVGGSNPPPAHSPTSLKALADYDDEDLCEGGGWGVEEGNDGELKVPRIMLEATFICLDYPTNLTPESLKFHRPNYGRSLRLHL